MERLIPLANGLDQVAQLRLIVRARDLAVGGTLLPRHDSAVVAALRSVAPGVAEVV